MAETLGHLSATELRHLLEESFEETLDEFFGDPDCGLEIKPELRDQLVRQMERVSAGKYGRLLEEVSSIFPD